MKQNHIMIQAGILSVAAFILFFSCKAAASAPSTETEAEVLSVTILDSAGLPFTVGQIDGAVGASIQFGVNVQASGGASAAVTWEVSGGNGKSDIKYAKLTIAADETAGTVLTVTASSVYDSTMSDSIQVVLYIPSAAQYDISVDNSISGGGVSVDGGITSVAAGTTVTLHLSTNPGYTFTSVSVTRQTGGAVQTNGAGDTRTFAMPPDNVTVTAVFTLIPMYTVSIPGSIPNGTVSADTYSAAEGQTITLTVTPNSGYFVDSLAVTRDGGGAVTLGGSLADKTRTFTMPPANVTVAAVFTAGDPGNPVIDGIKIGDTVAGKGTLVWRDEFLGTSLDTTKWNIETGTGSQYGITNWGNSELEYFQAANATVAGGVLTIESKKENAGGHSYTSARITTGQIRNGTTTASPWVNQKYSAKTGRVEARIKSSKGTGFWPAFWMLGSNAYGDIQGSSPLITQQVWPRCGEIDILEFNGGKEYSLVQTIHFGQTYNQNYFPMSNTYTYRPGGVQTNLADDYHVYGVAWNETQLQFYLDDTVTVTRTWSSFTATQKQYVDCFYNDAGFAIILNLAIGGNMGGGTPADSAFTDGTGNNTLQVDWVRVYE